MCLTITASWHYVVYPIHTGQTGQECRLLLLRFRDWRNSYISLVDEILCKKLSPLISAYFLWEMCYLGESALYMKSVSMPLIMIAVRFYSNGLSAYYYHIYTDINRKFYWISWILINWNLMICLVMYIGHHMACAGIVNELDFVLWNQMGERQFTIDINKT